MSHSTKPITRTVTPTIGHNHLVPTPQEILNLPLANAGVYTLTLPQVLRTRTHIYQLNSNNVRGWKWRTTKLPYLTERKLKSGKVKLVPSKDLFTLLVWRVA